MTYGTSLDDILIRLEERQPRVISLVPSYTESLFDLGFGRWICGATDYCNRPEVGLEKVPRVGGVWNCDIERIIALSPDLVIANQEENKPEVIYRIEQAGIPVWVTFPKTIIEMFDVLSGMVKLYHDESASLRVRMLEASFDWAAQAASEQRKPRFFCPIWEGEAENGQLWWMAFNRDTYASDLIEQLGGENIFSKRSRLYPLGADLGLDTAEPPGARDTRYPRVRPEEVISADPEVILLPDEPFAFDRASNQRLLDVLRGTSAVRAGRVYPIDGSLIAWYGTRIGKALDQVPQYFLM